MKHYNKIPFKERMHRIDYSYKQTEKQEELLLKREMKQLEREKFDAFCRTQEYETEKDREANEVYKKLEAMAKGGAEE